MKKYLAMLVAAMLCACCLGLAACGGSSSSSAASGSASSSAASSESASAAASGSASASAASASASAASASASAAASSAAASASASAAANPADKFVGEWKMGAMQMNGITAWGDLAQTMGWTSGAMTIANDGTGTLDMNGKAGKFTWTQAGDNAITIAVEDASEGNFGGIANSTITYKDGILSLEATSNGTTGTILFSKDGTIPGLDPITMDRTTPITSPDALVGVWNITGFASDGAYAKGDTASLTSMMGQGVDYSMTFNADGTATVFGANGNWTVDGNGATLTLEGISLPIMAYGSDIVIDLGQFIGSSLLAVYSK